MAVTRINRFIAKPGMEEALHGALLSVVPAIANLKGCLKVRLLSSLDDPADFIGYEEWTSVEAHKSAGKAIAAAEIAKITAIVAATPRGDYYAG
ncbi:MAG: antibiotic biosynthesis monooxygenase family protein [Parvularculaceae bacterium]